MKELSYLQFYYGGDYTKEIIEIPNDSLIFKVTNTSVRHYYKEKNTYSYTILILSKENIQNLDCICLGEWYLASIDLVYSEYDFNDFNEFPKIEFYIVRYNFDKVDLTLPIEDIEERAIWSISKFKSIDSNYLYCSYITIRNYFTMEESYLLGYDKFDIDTLFGYKTKIVFGDMYKKLYEKLFNRILNKIKN